eukprot:365556-Rhodomonas_salina.1
MQPYNRWVTMEDLVADQEETMHTRAGEALFDAAGNFFETLNITVKLHTLPGTDEAIYGYQEREDDYIDAVINDEVARYACALRSPVSSDADVRFTSTRIIPVLTSVGLVLDRVVLTRVCWYQEQLEAEREDGVDELASELRYNNTPY